MVSEKWMLKGIGKERAGSKEFGKGKGMQTCPDMRAKGWAHFCHLPDLCHRTDKNSQHR